MEYMPYAIDAIRLRSGMYGIPLVPYHVKSLN